MNEQTYTPCKECKQTHCSKCLLHKFASQIVKEEQQKEAVKPSAVNIAKKDSLTVERLASTTSAFVVVKDMVTKKLLAKGDGRDIAKSQLCNYCVATTSIAWGKLVLWVYANEVVQ